MSMIQSVSGNTFTGTPSEPSSPLGIIVALITRPSQLGYQDQIELRYRAIRIEKDPSFRYRYGHNIHSDGYKYFNPSDRLNLVREALSTCPSHEPSESNPNTLQPLSSASNVSTAEWLIIAASGITVAGGALAQVFGGSNKHNMENLLLVIGGLTAIMMASVMKFERYTECRELKKIEADLVKEVEGHSKFQASSPSTSGGPSPYFGFDQVGVGIGLGLGVAVGLMRGAGGPSPVQCPN